MLLRQTTLVKDYASQWNELEEYANKRDEWKIPQNQVQGWTERVFPKGHRQIGNRWQEIIIIGHETDS